MKRPIQITVAAILQVVVGVAGAVFAISVIQQGATSGTTDDGPGVMFMAMGFATALLSLVSAYGLWLNQKWGKVLAIVTRAVDGLTALPGLFFAPTTNWQIAALLGVTISIAVIVLVLWPTPRATPAQA